MGYFLYKKIFFQKKGEQKFNLTFLKILFNYIIYLNLVVFTQGVLGYFTDLVRPPCG
jgi:hypothetical protein